MTESTPKAIEVNCETGEVIERDLTPDEIAANEAAAVEAEANAKKAEAEARANAKSKQAVLDKLGLTADEAAALFSE